MRAHISRRCTVMDEYRAVIYEDANGVRLEPITDLPADQRTLIHLAFEVGRALGEFGMHRDTGHSEDSITDAETIDPVSFLRGEIAMPWKRVATPRMEKEDPGGVEGEGDDDDGVPGGGPGDDGFGIDGGTDGGTAGGHCWIYCVPTRGGPWCRPICD
jgi:hypothetical protein